MAESAAALRHQMYAQGVTVSRQQLIEELGLESDAAMGEIEEAFHRRLTLIMARASVAEPSPLDTEP